MIFNEFKNGNYDWYRQSLLTKLIMNFGYIVYEQNIIHACKTMNQ